jgi:2-keto-4-pentenoate hydratase/2-oxohepta-3-ene-1,7-dioic acid hydratase in catechol pathway
MTVLLRSAAIMLSFALAACDEGPKSNLASVEARPLAPALARPTADSTFAQVRRADGRIATLLVTGLGKDAVRAVDLTNVGAPLDADIFDVASGLGQAGLAKAVAQPDARQAYAIADLLPPAGTATRHVATGTNFREHAKEAEIDEVFNFPKLGPATPARTTVALRPGVLLDYEVEICLRFDRDIRSMADFDAAQKGFFLCGDFTDRATLLRLVNPRDLGSGEGFTDAKSGVDFFPTGPFLVIPHDWRTFVQAERMTTHVNGQVRQDARGGEMILDFRALVQKALTNGGGGHYTYRGARVPLLAGGRIARGSAIMSGTSEGVVFMPPRARDYLSGGSRYIFGGPMIRGESAYRVMIETFIAKERRSGRYLRSGDVIAHASSSMGNVRIRVVPAGRAFRRTCWESSAPSRRSER